MSSLKKHGKYRLTQKMDMTLRSLRNTTENDRQGSLTFMSGFPTYEALERRGLIAIELVKWPRYKLHLTQKGWEYLGVEVPDNSWAAEEAARQAELERLAKADVRAAAAELLAMS
jgi:hypothetical protein